MITNTGLYFGRIFRSAPIIHQSALNLRGQPPNGLKGIDVAAVICDQYMQEKAALKGTTIRVTSSSNRNEPLL
jgi:hypothetical protein